MTKNLVIVESPAKSKTIEKYLGKDYKVVSSKGHIRDLATKGKYGFGIELENNFNPIYEIIKGKNKDVAQLKKEVSASKKVFLATDPDREGEAISWHLKDELDLKDADYDRVVFNEITKTAVTDAFNHVRKIDDGLVHSQETRRMLDRIIGFRLSKLMQSKTGGKSAGRVQSVALKIIVDRESEINAFIKEEYWTIEGIFKEFKAKLEKYGTKGVEIHNETEANEILDKLSNAFKIESIDKKTKNRSSKAPFITSTLQQEASTKLNFNARKTMSIAQKLYEGIDLKDETVGLITYMRTDSIRLSDEYTKSAFAFIGKEYGTKYMGFAKKSKKTENVQDAHEAIRPTSVNRTPDSIKSYLSDDEYKLYKIIYFRALASLMKEAKVEQTSVVLDNNNYKFKATGQIIIFDGYLRVYSDYESSEETILPPFDKYNSNIIVASSIEKEQHFTTPPPRYTEAKLIKEMEELGIGRPSTYAKTISTLVDRNYVNILEKKFVPTEIGIETTEKLQEFFHDLINAKYTAKMESDLDKISDNEVVWYKLLDEFYSKFEPKVQEAFDNMEKVQKETGELCPECKSPLVVRHGRYGEFVACSNYPACKYIKKESKETKEFGKCPECGGTIVEKRTKKGKIFYGCNSYPDCKYATWAKPKKEE
jgi:DNA topoisomerase-1